MKYKELIKVIHAKQKPKKAKRINRYALRRTIKARFTKQKDERGKRNPAEIMRGMTKIENTKRGELYLKGTRYLAQDLGVGVSMKVIALKITRPNREAMPFEHLTLARITPIK